MTSSIPKRSLKVDVNSNVAGNEINLNSPDSPSTPSPPTYVTRNGRTFEKRFISFKENTSSLPELLRQRRGLNRQMGFSSRLISSLHRFISGRGVTEADHPPDESFCANTYVKLSRGITAYRLMEPALASPEVLADDNPRTSLPLVVCLHGLATSSYIFADLADLLMDCDNGPQCRVLVFDFYGRGRSPWSGVTCSIDVLVNQTKELLDVLGFSHPVCLLGYDMGCNVAAGFAAKFPDLCLSITMLSPLGVKYKPLFNEKLLNRKYIGEYVMHRRRGRFAKEQRSDFFNANRSSPVWPLICKQVAMTQWQIENCPGYLGAILSTYRNFPLRRMEELYAAIGQYPRSVLIILGRNDEICPFRKCISRFEEAFPKALIVDVAEAGHNVLFEKFDAVATEVLEFHKTLFSKEESLSHQIDHFGLPSLTERSSS